MAPRRAAFFSLPTLLLVGGLVGLVLYLLFPRQAIFEDPDYLQNPDGLSISYLEILLRSDEGNIPLRINLARMLKNSGQLERSAQVLAPAMDSERLPYRVMESYLELLPLRMNAQPEGPAREAVRRELFETLQQLLEQPYNMDRIMRLHQPAQRWLTQEQRRQILLALQQRVQEPRHQLQVARDLARLQEASGQPGAALETLRPHLDKVESGHRRAFVDNLIRLELASNNPAGALALFRQHHGAGPDSSETLRQGVRLARLAGATADEQRWLEQLAAREPDNLPLQRELLAQQLGAGQLVRALATVRRLQARPGAMTVADRERVAQVLEWNDRPAEAAAAWRELYRDSDSQRAYDRALDLTRGLFQWDRLADLLETRRQRRQLDEAGYEWLARARIGQGDYAAARRHLEQGLARYPRSQPLKDSLLDLLLGLRDLPAAIALLESLPRKTDEDRLLLGRLYWQTRQPEQALETLNFEPGDPVLADQVASMRLDLAILLGRDDPLREDYRRLVAMDESRHSVTMLERLRYLAVTFGDYPTALRISRYQYETLGNEESLAAMAEYQLAMADWEGLEQTLALWQQDFASAGQRPRFWALRGGLDQSRGETRGAEEAYRKGYELAPEDEDLLINRAWNQLSAPEDYRDTLPVLLAQLGQDPSEAAYPVLAYGHSALGNTRESLHWFRQGLPGRGDDPAWLMDMARVLDQSGAPGDASDLRQRVLAMPGEVPEGARERLTLYREEHRQRQAWEALGRFLQAPRGTRDNGSDTLETMAFFALAQGQAAVAEALLARLPQRQGQGGDGVDGEAKSARQRLKESLHPKPESREQSIVRLQRQLSRLDGDLTGEERQPLTRNTVLLHQRFNRSLQLGTQWQNLGGFTVRRSGITGQFSRDPYRWTLNADNLSSDGRGQLLRAPQTATEFLVRLDRSGAAFDWSLALGQRPREQTRDTSASGELNWQGLDRVSLGAGYHYRERTLDSAEAWWITRRDRLSLSAVYNPFTRLSLSGRLDHLTVTSLEGETLGEGVGVDATATYTLLRNDPAWTLSANLQSRRLSLAEALPEATRARLRQPLATAGLITETYERIGLSTRWFHGEPHALYRTTPSPRYFLGLGAGYVLTTRRPDLGLEAGLGWRILGDDELALSGRLTTEGLDGEGRTDFNLTYTLYFGR